MPRSGKFCASNDILIGDLLNDARYDVREDGTIWRAGSAGWKQTGIAKTCKGGKLYHHLKYKGSNILVHRIVHRKFNGRLANDLVINHIDGNSLNNHPSNLELINQSNNMIHRHATAAPRTEEPVESAESAQEVPF